MQFVGNHWGAKTNFWNEQDKLRYCKEESEDHSCEKSSIMCMIMIIILLLISPL